MRHRQAGRQHRRWYGGRKHRAKEKCRGRQAVRRRQAGERRQEATWQRARGREGRQCRQQKVVAGRRGGR